MLKTQAKNVFLSTNGDERQHEFEKLIRQFLSAQKANKKENKTKKDGAHAPPFL